MGAMILVLHVLIAVALIGLVLFQHGRGADMGASFGSGSSQTVFGSQGSGDFLSHTTAILAAVFFVTSLGLAIVAKNAQDLPEILPGLEGVVIEQAQEIPVVVPQNDQSAESGLPAVAPSQENGTGSHDQLPVVDDSGK